MRPVTIYDVPPLMPGECGKCKCNDLAEGREYFVDIGIDIEWVGVLYLCNICLSDIVRVTPDILHKSIVDAAAEAQMQFNQAAEKKDKRYAKLTGALEAIGLSEDTLIALQEARTNTFSEAILPDDESKQSEMIGLLSIVNEEGNLKPEVSVDLNPLLKLELGK